MQPSAREAVRTRPSRVVLALALLLIVPVGAMQLQRGAAEAHHNYDAPLTIETPWDILPCELPLCAYPALLADPLAGSLAWLRLAAGGARELGGDRGPAPAAADTPAPDAPRAPPLRSPLSAP